MFEHGWVRVSYRLSQAFGSGSCLFRVFVECLYQLVNAPFTCFYPLEPAASGTARGSSLHSERVEEDCKVCLLGLW